MLDVKITAYVVPVAEQPQASLTPVISVANIADEGAVITGLIRIYRESTGLMIYSSELAVTQLEHHSTTNIAALTPFDPLAPADDDYFIKADITATSYLPGPPTHDSLGAWYFDIETPPMGAVPANHHALHEEDGSDEIETSDLGTTEMDDTLVLKPDGAGGVHFTASPAGVTDHGALTGLADDDHTQYRLRHQIFYECEFLLPNTAGVIDPWRVSPRNLGTLYAVGANSLHPGIEGIRSSTSADSGYSIHTDNISILLAGGEVSLCWHRPQTLALTTRTHGFLDTYTATDPTDGVWIWQDPATGIIYGRCKNVGGAVTTSTGFQLITNTWYCEKIVVNSDATQVDFYCYAEDGTELWHDSLATYIPVAGVLASVTMSTNSGTTALNLDEVDYLRILIPNRRPLL